MNKIPQPVEVDESQIPRDESVSYEDVISDEFEYEGTEVKIGVSGENSNMIKAIYDDDIDTATSIAVIWAYQYEFPGVDSVVQGTAGSSRTRFYRLSRCYYGQRDLEMLESDKNG